MLVGSSAGGMTLLGLPNPPLAAGGQAAPVGEYLPPAGVENFVEFVPDAKKTPVCLHKKHRIASVLSGSFGLWPDEH